MPGPLAGVRVVELAGLGPAPFAAMLLADLGAEVVRVERPARGHDTPVGTELSVALERNRRSVAVDLKHPEGLEVVLKLVDQAEVLVEGYRPGVTERLGLGPDVCLARNPALVYARMTGWGQTGPLAHDVGHDLNYIALAGALAAIGQAGGPPTIPLNLVGDLGGGGMLLAFGTVSALLHARASGEGQVVDAAMVDGVATLMAPYVPQRDWGPRGTNSVDGGSPFYQVYETADGGYVTVAALEPPFYAALLDVLGLDPGLAAEQLDPATWPRTRERFAEIFRQASRDEWVRRMEGHPVCFAPVLTVDEAAAHPHMVERDVFIDVGGRRQPAPVPRFSTTPAAPPAPRPGIGVDADTVLSGLGISAAEIRTLRDRGIVG